MNEDTFEKTHDLCRFESTSTRAEKEKRVGSLS